FRLHRVWGRKQQEKPYHLRGKLFRRDRRVVNLLRELVDEIAAASFDGRRRETGKNLVHKCRGPEILVGQNRLIANEPVFLPPRRPLYNRSYFRITRPTRHVFPQPQRPESSQDVSRRGPCAAMMLRRIAGEWELSCGHISRNILILL